MAIPEGIYHGRHPDLLPWQYASSARGRGALVRMLTFSIVLTCFNYSTIIGFEFEAIEIKMLLNRLLRHFKWLNFLPVTAMWDELQNMEW